MRTAVRVCVCALFLMCCVWRSQGSKVLVMPYNMGHNSRLRNLVKLAEMLQADGHEVTLMTNNLVEHLSEGAKVHRIMKFYSDPTPVFNIMSDELKVLMKNLDNPLDFLAYLRGIAPGIYTICDTMLGNEELMHTLRDSKFDLMVLDIAQICASVIKDYLDVPAIVWSNYGPAFYRTAFFPENPAYMCPSDGFSCTSDKMTFWERFNNLYHMIVRNYIALPEFINGYDQLKVKHQMNTTFDVESVFSRSIVMSMIDFSIEFPRPLMPNVIPMPYLFIEPPKPLPDSIQSFLDSSSHKGIIYLSFGTLMDTFPEDKADIVASAFGRFPEYRFIWRNKGASPENIQANTLMLDWAPQLDLLGGRQVKIFITHCGISSTYETVYLGVPYIAMPLFWDQDRNAAKLVQRVKSGVLYDFYNMTEDSLYETINEMLVNHDSYKQTAEKAAAIANDHPVPPKQMFLWWANYTIRTKGAPHLMADSVHKLNYFQYLSLDVVICLLVLFTVGIFMLYIPVRLIKKQF